MTDDNVFFIIRDKNSGKYLKKSTNSAYAADVLTTKIGNARIFSSEAMAKIGYNPYQCVLADFEVIPMRATLIEY
jgi:hypothetical protein